MVIGKEFQSFLANLCGGHSTSVFRPAMFKFLHKYWAQACMWKQVKRKI
jgi:enterochelin esterase-like enzyme